MQSSRVAILTGLQVCVFAVGWSCASQLPLQQQSSVPQSFVAISDSLTANDRSRIVEAVASFRNGVFPKDSTKLDGCAVVALIGVGSDYPRLLRPYSRQLILDSSRTDCSSQQNMGSPPKRLVLLSVGQKGSEAVVEASLVGGSYSHRETYRLRGDTNRRGGRDWIPMEVRIWGLVIAD